MQDQLQMLSLVVPIYKSEANLPFLLTAIADLALALRHELEAVFVVDASPDDSYQILSHGLAEAPFRSRVILLTKNEGSFIAIRAGLSEGTGDYFAMLAADLQEPIELISDMLNVLKKRDVDVVIAARASRADRWSERLLSGVFWTLYRNLVMPMMPRGGFDTFACTRAFRDQILSLNESHSSLVAQILWLGGRRETVTYARRTREIGQSSWTLKKKIRYLADSVFSFTDLPIKCLTYFGGIIAMLSAFVGMFVLYARLSGAIAVPGYTALALLVTFFGASNLYALGVVGTYAWRAYENTKVRPLFSIQSRQTFDYDGHKK